MKWALASIGLFVAALTLGCATGERRTISLEREAPPTPEQIAQRERALAGDRRMQPGTAERFDVAVVGGHCAPKHGAKQAVTACVNERPCNGFGRRLPGGEVICACFELRGGCPDDMFCNQRTRECMKLPADPYHTR